MWLLRTLWEDDRTLFPVSLTIVVDELERPMMNELKAKEIISAYIADVIGDLAVVTEAIRQIKIYQPWAETFENILVEK